jgi:hypothetical protein
VGHEPIRRYKRNHELCNLYIASQLFFRCYVGKIPCECGADEKRAHEQSKEEKYRDLWWYRAAQSLKCNQHLHTAAKETVIKGAPKLRNKKREETFRSEKTGRTHNFLTFE